MQKELEHLFIEHIHSDNTNTDLIHSFMLPMKANITEIEGLLVDKEITGDFFDDLQMHEKMTERKNEFMTANKRPISKEKMKNCTDDHIISKIESEILHDTSETSWEDISGLENAKIIIKEIVIWPLLRPDLFNGLRGPPKGILLFGPPGTGKTLIGRCIASQIKATFFQYQHLLLHLNGWVKEKSLCVHSSK